MHRMSLRTKLLYSFGLLAVLPLLLMGLFHYVGSMRTVERHLVAQVEQIVERAADELARRHEVHVSDLRLLADNAETQWLFRARAVELRDASGAVVLAFGSRVPDWTTLPGERVAASRSSDGRPLGRAVPEQPSRTSSVRRRRSRRPTTAWSRPALEGSC
jgi:hypothetical protein